MKPVHILLVEDNEGDILLTTEAFENAQINNTLSVVRDGMQAIDFLNKEGGYSHVTEPHILLLDLNLPKRNGFEVLQFIKEDVKFKHIPVIILSTSCAQTDIQKCYEKYANCFISKPLEIEVIYNVISKIENFWISIVKLPGKDVHDDKR